MKITLGEWKTERGEKAIVAAHNPEAPRHAVFIGWIDGEVRAWTEDGGIGDGFELDRIVAPWTEPVPWDWSTTPPWINWIAKNANGRWLMFCEEPHAAPDAWCFENGSWPIPQSHSPKWSGDWKLSKTQRPKEVAK